MVTTTSTSMRVKPAERPVTGSVLPVADFGIDALAAGHAVGAQRPHVDFSVNARIEELVLIAPGIPGQTIDIAALLPRSEEHTSELQSRGHLVCRLLLEKKNHQHAS